MKGTDKKKLFSEAKISEEQKKAELKKKEAERNESVYSQILSEAELLGPEKYREAQARIAQMRRLDKEKAQLEKQDSLKQDALDKVSGKKVEFDEYKPKFTDTLTFRLVLVFSIIAIIGIGIGIYFWFISVKHSKPSSILLSQTNVITRGDFDLIAWLPDYKGENKNIIISTNSSIIKIYDEFGEETTEVEAGSAFTVKVTYDQKGNVISGVADITVSDALTQEQRATCRVTVDSPVKNIAFNTALNSVDYRYITQTVDGGAVATPTNANSGIFKRNINYSIYSVNAEGNLIAIRNLDGKIESFVQKTFTVYGSGDYVAVYDSTDSKHILGFRLATATEKLNSSLTKYSDKGLGTSIDTSVYNLDKWTSNFDLASKTATVTSEGVVKFLMPGNICLVASVDQYKYPQTGDKPLVVYKEMESKIIPISSVICEEYIDDSYDKNMPIVKNVQSFVTGITIDSGKDTLLEQLANSNDVKNYLIENFVSFKITEAGADAGYQAVTKDDFVVTKNGYNVYFTPKVFSKGYLKCELVYNGSDEGFTTAGFIQFNFDSLSVEGVHNLSWKDVDLSGIITPSKVVDLADLVEFDLSFTTSSSLVSASTQDTYKEYLLKNKLSLVGSNGVKAYRLYELGAPTTKFEVILPPFTNNTATLSLNYDGGVISGNNQKAISYDTTAVDYSISNFSFDDNYVSINANGKPEQTFNLLDMNVNFNLALNVSGYTASDKVIEIYKDYFLENTITLTASEGSGVIIAKDGVNISVIFPLNANLNSINLNIVEGDDTLTSDAVSVSYETKDVAYSISNLTFSPAYLNQGVTNAYYKLDLKDMLTDFDLTLAGVENPSEAVVEFYKNYIIENHLKLKIADVKVGGVSVNSNIVSIKVSELNEHYVILPAMAQGLVNLAFYYTDGGVEELVSGASYVGLNYNTNGVNYQISNLSYTTPSVVSGSAWTDLDLSSSLNVNFDISFNNVYFTSVSSDVKADVESLVKQVYKDYIIKNELGLVVNQVTNTDDAGNINPGEVIVSKSGSIVNVIFPAVKRGNITFTFSHTKNGTSSEVQLNGNMLSVNYNTLQVANLVAISNVRFSSSYNAVNLTAPYVEWDLGVNGLNIDFDLSFNGIDNATDALKNAYKSWALNQITLSSSASAVVISSANGKALIEFPAVATGEATISFNFKGSVVTSITKPAITFDTTGVASLLTVTGVSIEPTLLSIATTNVPLANINVSSVVKDFNLVINGYENASNDVINAYKDYVRANLFTLNISSITNNLGSNIDSSYMALSQNGVNVEIIFPADEQGSAKLDVLFNGLKASGSSQITVTFNTTSVFERVTGASDIVINSNYAEIEVYDAILTLDLSKVISTINIEFEESVTDGYSTETVNKIKSLYSKQIIKENVTITPIVNGDVVVKDGFNCTAILPGAQTGTATVNFIFTKGGNSTTLAKTIKVNYNTTNVVSIVSGVTALVWNNNYFTVIEAAPYAEIDLFNSGLALDFNVTFNNVANPSTILQQQYKEYIKNNLLGVSVNPMYSVTKQGNVFYCVFPAFSSGEGNVIFTFNGDVIAVSSNPTISYDTTHPAFEITNLTFNSSYAQDAITYTNYKALNLNSMNVDFDVVLVDYPDISSIDNTIIEEYKKYILNNLLSLNITGISATEKSAYSKVGGIPSVEWPDEWNSSSYVAGNTNNNFSSQTAVSGQNAIKASSGSSNISGFEEASVKKEALNLYVIFPVASNGTLTVSFSVASYGSAVYTVIPNGDASYDLTFKFNTENVADYFNVTGLTIKNEWKDKSQSAYTSSKYSYTFNLLSDLNLQLQVSNTSNDKFVSLALADQGYMNEIIKHYVNLSTLSGVSLKTGKDVYAGYMVVKKDGLDMKIYADENYYGNFTFAFTFNGNGVGTSSNPATMKLYFWATVWTGNY